MTVVVTGAAGFLGRHVVRALQRRADCAVVPLSRRSLPGLGRVRDYSESPVGDVLIHLAEESDRGRAASGGQNYAAHASRTSAALLARGYGRIVYASSGALYDDSLSRAKTPDDPVCVTDTYTAVKRNSELTFLADRRAAVARLANVYGPGMATESVLATILKQIPGTGVVRVRDLKPVRDFLWVEDAADGLAAMAVGKACGLFNLGTGVGVSIGELARLCLEVSGEVSRRPVVGESGGKVSHIVLDSSRTEATFHWLSAVSLRNGVRRLLSC